MKGNESFNKECCVFFYRYLNCEARYLEVLPAISTLLSKFSKVQEKDRAKCIEAAYKLKVIYIKSKTLHDIEISIVNLNDNKGHIYYLYISSFVFNSGLLYLRRERRLWQLAET